MDKRIKKGSAVLTAWTLIAVMGISPAGAAFPSYASVMERSDQEINIASSSEARRNSEITEAEHRKNELRELGEEQPEEGTAKDEKPEPEESAKDEKPKTEETEEERKEEEENGEEEAELPEDKRTATPSEAVPVEEDVAKWEELQEATPSNALMMTGDLWGGIEMSDHFDGEGTEESPYLLQNNKYLKLLAQSLINI